jgi:phospholipid/cholesterol/gamma-HCH transport system permease protein
LNRPLTTVDYHGDSLGLSGPLNLGDLAAVSVQVLDILDSHPGSALQVDLSQISALDTAGAVFLKRCLAVAAARDLQLEYGPLPAQLQPIYDLVPAAAQPQPLPAPDPWLERLGGSAMDSLQRADHFFFLMSDLTWGSVTALLDHKGLRRGSFIDECIGVGYRSLPIIALILFLIGAVSALQSAAQLRQFGADILVADLLAIGIFKELGPLMTAIIVSGRSGSAIAAEVATMKFNEELDALQTMGIEPLRFVAVPKMWAMLLSLPLLTIIADLVGVLGGVFISITSLQVPPLAFIERAIEAVVVRDILTGLLKSVSFAWAITLIAIHFGLHASGGPAGVGRATTSAVVASLFGIILLDSLWGLLFHLQ